VGSQIEQHPNVANANVDVMDMMPKGKTETVVVMGEVGWGRAFTKNCLMGEPISCWKEDIFQQYNLHNDDSMIATLIDVPGFGNNRYENYQILQKLANDIARDCLHLDCVLICMSFEQFIHKRNHNILNFIKAFTTKEFQGLIRVIVTDSPSWLVTESLKMHLLSEIFNSLGRPQKRF
jgi:hypothetical protein